MLAPIIIAIDLMLLGMGSSQDLRRTENRLAQQDIKWKVFTQQNSKFTYRVEYPSGWVVEAKENAWFFRPAHGTSNKASIAIVLINYKQTPPVPVHYTYTTVRNLRVDDEEILIRKRDPSPATEKYFAELKKGDYVAEFRFLLDRQYDPVFDHMLSTFTFNLTK